MLKPDSADVINGKSQLIASIINKLENIRIENAWAQIDSSTQSILLNNDLRFAKAVEIIEDTRIRLQDTHSILGSNLTKHGEAAEFLDVAKINADAVMKGASDWATTDVPRTGPVDYVWNGIEVQSKFGHSELNTLRMVFEHLEKYPEYARTDGSIYVIPKDQLETIKKILSTDKLHTLQIDGRKLSSLEALARHINKIEDATGRSFSEVVKASGFKYDEVQLGKIQETCDNMRTDYEKMHHARAEEIKAEDEELKTEVAKKNPSLGEATKAGLAGATVSAGITILCKVWAKHSMGKKFYEFSRKDWEDIGVSGAQGFISGVSIYGLTNYVGMSAPIAGGFVSAGFGIASLVKDYRSGKISKEQLMDEAGFVCFQSSAATLGAVLGQAIIPIPVLGTLIGSIGASMLTGIFKKHYMRKEQRIAEEYQRRIDAVVEKYQAQYGKYVNEVLEKLNSFNSMLDMCFDEKLNAVEQLYESAKLAIKAGVPEEEVLETIEDVKVYFET